MEASKELPFFIFLASLVLLVKSRCDSEADCSNIWVDNKVHENVWFSFYENRTIYNDVINIHWRWMTDINEKWSLYYKEWPRKGIMTGGFVLSNENEMALAKLNWKIKNGIILWTTTYRKAFSPLSWNATVCKINAPMKLLSWNRGWSLLLDDILIIGGKSGRKNLNEESLFYSYMKGNDQSAARSKREAEDMEGENKKTVWNKIKGWFKELFDEGDNDNRGWLTRVGDWLMGFLQRVLT